MQKKDIYTLVALIGLTILTAVFSTQFSSLKYVSAIILILSAFKFLLVSFNFMELKKANTAWKAIIIIYLIIFVTIISVLV
jgi:predicted membrane channel-forming protein YqfA (hemolysin III family)